MPYKNLVHLERGGGGGSKKSSVDLMPSVNAPATAVVTGVNGYLGTWVAKSFLDQGYHVRGTIRTAAKGEELKHLFAAYGENYESVIVKDVLEVRIPRDLWCTYILSTAIRTVHSMKL